MGTRIAVVVTLLLASLPAARPADATQMDAAGVPAHNAGAGAAVAVPERARKHVLTIASANVREGSRSRPRTDLRAGRDRKKFVRRLMARANRMPGVVVLQETYGSARAYVRALNRHPRAKRTGASYRLATRPKLRSGQRRCGPTRRPRHQRVQTTAIVVNRDAVKAIAGRGSIGTWGRWRKPRDRARTVRGCAHQPWALLRTRSKGLVRVVGVHLAPVNAKLKTRATRHLTDRLRRLEGRTPKAAVVVAGDFNLTRQPRRLGERERPGGKVRAAHRMLLRNGLRDANRVARPRGRKGVIGYRVRVDFVYTTARVTRASFDRCYLGYRSGRACPRSARVFRTRDRFAACQRRADRGARRSVACPQRWHRRYYSDHPMLTTRLRW